MDITGAVILLIVVGTALYGALRDAWRTESARVDRIIADALRDQDGDR